LKYAKYAKKVKVVTFFYDRKISKDKSPSSPQNILRHTGDDGPRSERMHD